MEPLLNNFIVLVKSNQGNFENTKIIDTVSDSGLLKKLQKVKLDKIFKDDTYQLTKDEQIFVDLIEKDIKFDAQDPIDFEGKLNLFLD